MSILPEHVSEDSGARRTLSDAEAIDRIVDRYKTWGQDEIFDNPSSLIEFIGDTLESTGRQTWFEVGLYLTDEAAS